MSGDDLPQLGVSPQGYRGEERRRSGFERSVAEQVASDGTHVISFDQIRNPRQVGVLGQDPHVRRMNTSRDNLAELGAQVYSLSHWVESVAQMPTDSRRTWGRRVVDVEARWDHLGQQINLDFVSPDLVSVDFYAPNDDEVSSRFYADGGRGLHVVVGWTSEHMYVVPSSIMRFNPIWFDALSQISSSSSHHTFDLFVEELPGLVANNQATGREGWNGYQDFKNANSDSSGDKGDVVMLRPADDCVLIAAYSTMTILDGRYDTMFSSDPDQSDFKEAIRWHAAGNPDYHPLVPVDKPDYMMVKISLK